MYYVSLRLNMVFLNGYVLLLFPMKWIGSVLDQEKMVFLKMVHRICGYSSHEPAFLHTPDTL